MEIDSAKSGVRPDLDEYLRRRSVKRTPFLQYKNLVERAETSRAWYEPTHAQRLNAFFEKVDWNEVDSNVERLPYLAQQLKKHTLRIKPKPAEDRELFTFAQNPDWKEHLDKNTLARVSALLRDYESCLSRIRACRAPIREKSRKRDIDRILYARGQEERYDPDELYVLFQELEFQRVTDLRQAIRTENWHLMDENQRETFLLEQLPESAFVEYYDLLEDFRFGGYRVLGDLICDIDDENTAKDRKRLFRETDSQSFSAMMRAYTEKRPSQSYREVVSAKCQELLEKISRPTMAVRYVVALGKRDLLWELLPDQIVKNVLEVRYAE